MEYQPLGAALVSGVQGSLGFSSKSFLFGTLGGGEDTAAMAEIDRPPWRRLGIPSLLL